ncbi:MAG TPA: phosphotransferase [Microlunatus sp.]|nr:phosphotransferase [Microlunatus sp.]
MIDLATASDTAIRHYAVDRGVDCSGLSRVERLSGGVSGTVVRLDARHRPVILKQALERLAVPDPWQADRRRILTEARALRVLGEYTPEYVPEVIDVDEDTLTLIMTCAPAEWWPWKERLLARQHPDSATPIARTLAEVLAAWHRGTAGQAAQLTGFDDHDTYRLLRTDPFYRALAEVHPGHADRLRELADGLHRDPVCLIQGDFSPKNVLVGSDPDALWVVDHEVAIQGRPVFDLAFLIAHLTLKAVERDRRLLLTAAAEFWRTYQQQWPASGVTPEELADHVAVLMLARVDGVSRVHYLSDRQRGLVRELAAAQLTEPRTIDDLWQRVRTLNGVSG